MMICGFYIDYRRNDFSKTLRLCCYSVSNLLKQVRPPQIRGMSLLKNISRTVPVTDKTCLLQCNFNMDMSGCEPKDGGFSLFRSKTAHIHQQDRHIFQLTGEYANPHHGLPLFRIRVIPHDQQTLVVSPPEEIIGEVSWICKKRCECLVLCWIDRPPAKIHNMIRNPQRGAAPGERNHGRQVLTVGSSGRKYMRAPSQWLCFIG